MEQFPGRCTCPTPPCTRARSRAGRSTCWPSPLLSGCCSTARSANALQWPCRLRRTQGCQVRAICREASPRGGPPVVPSSRGRAAAPTLTERCREARVSRCCNNEPDDRDPEEITAASAGRPLRADDAYARSGRSTLRGAAQRRQRRPTGVTTKVDSSVRPGQFLLREPQRSHDARGPLGLPRSMPDEILANLDLHVQQATYLCVSRDRVVRLIAQEVRLVVGHDQATLAAQRLKHQGGQAAIAVIEHGCVHGAAHALENIRHGMLRNEDRRPPGTLACVEQLPQPRMIRLEDLAAPSQHLLLAQAGIARNLDEFPDRRNR